MLSRVIAGARDVLKIAPLAACLGVVFGVIVGMFMGYLGGWLDNVFSRIVEAFLALPVVLIALLAVTTLGQYIAGRDRRGGCVCLRPWLPGPCAAP